MLDVKELWIAVLLLYDTLNAKLPCHVRVPKHQEVSDVGAQERVTVSVQKSFHSPNCVTPAAQGMLTVITVQVIACTHGARRTPYRTARCNVPLHRVTSHNTTSQARTTCTHSAHATSLWSGRSPRCHEPT